MFRIQAKLNKNKKQNSIHSIISCYYYYYYYYYYLIVYAWIHIDTNQTDNGINVFVFILICTGVL